MTKLSIREFIKNFDEGQYDDSGLATQVNLGWYDWFCRDTSLRNKTYKLTAKLKTILASSKIDQDTMGVIFKNNCPVYGSLYDDFRICDLETGDVVFTVVPASGHVNKRGQASVWGKENGFREALVEGTWRDVKRFFLA